MKEKTNEIEKTLLSHAKDIGIVIISFLILLIFHFLQPLRNLEGPGQTMIGILLMATILWITEPIPLPATGGFAVGVTKRRPPVSRRMNGTKRLIGDEHNLDIAKTIALARAYRDLAIGIHNPNRILSWRET